jgi:hypothetical protein
MDPRMREDDIQRSSFPPPLVIPGYDRESMPLDPRMREDDTQYPSFPAATGNPCIHGSPIKSGMTGNYSNHG